MPNKGDIIIIDGKQYRVLKINENVAEVLCMYDASSSLVFDTNSPYNNTYAGKNIDTYCNNTFYSGLSSAMKSAIVDKTFTQDSWTFHNSAPTGSHYTGKAKWAYYLTLANAAFGTSITRHCYCLSVQDVLDYLEATTSMGTSDTTLTDTNVWKMFWNTSSSPSTGFIWLRSANSSESIYVFAADDTYGRMNYNTGNAHNTVRPAFQIDLSKVDWTARKSVDVTTLAGWDSLSSGSHSITIVARANGYRDSEPSAAVSVKKSAFTQVFPSKTSNNYTLFENLNQSKIYSILLSSWSGGVGYLKYENGSWTTNLMYIVSQTSNSVKAIANGGGGFAEYIDGITLEGDTEATTADFEGLSYTAVYARYECFVEGTKITLSDGSTKPVQDIQYGDKVLCYDFTNGVQTTSYIDWMIPERIATKYWEITLSDGTILNLVGSNGKSHRLYNITKQRFDYPQDFEPNDLALKEDGTTAHVVSCREIEKTVRFYNIASHEHINVYANGVLTSNRLNNRYKIVDNKFTDEKVMTDEEVSDYRAYLDTIKA